MGTETIASVVVTAVTGICGLWAARAARRTPRQERRDDFTVVTNRMDRDIERLEGRQREQQDQITGQGAAISWLVVDRRSLVRTIRKAGLDPPLAKPIPERARPYLDHIDV
ncbi:hypothetical protein [Streptomyces spectabilis]|uniref:Uncharacterized protein n=2 Tax=Streptomyces spectabilis TaxID=68270 RepID=A0A7W8EWS2_STRST|nr:hypothetical protein [Streptomyces spectabilis]MBB5108267.1 hypothetical protein [Streptomyces spectabilis]MCI3901027.1 hypothetical protein [Streptomyces spectabilis]GGV45545.1 hypothetical protein GCM10010245_71280 [Streptomyces spectabilis]